MKTYKQYTRQRITFGKGAAGKISSKPMKRQLAITKKLDAMFAELAALDF